jgi:UDP:flavonoid glycosyltransferase YjiC (YdhE family)
MYAGAGALVLFLGVNIWAVSALGLFGGDSGDPQAVQVVDDRTPTPSASPSPVVPQTTTPPPVPKTTVTPTQKPTQRPTQQPTRTKTTERRTEERPDPTPTRTTTAKKTPKPRRSPSTPPTREEILRQYCVQQGWDPEWCDTSNWPQDPADDPRNGP